MNDDKTKLIKEIIDQVDYDYVSNVIKKVSGEIDVQPGIRIESRQVGHVGNTICTNYLHDELANMNLGLLVKRQKYSAPFILKLTKPIMVSALKKGLEDKLKILKERKIEDEEIIQNEIDLVNSNIQLIDYAGAYLKENDIRKIENVFAIKKGKSSEHVIVSAHFDTITRGNLIDPNRDPVYGIPNSPDIVAPGANDNGTGIAAVLMAAKILSKYDFKKSIHFTFFNAEEMLFIGSLKHSLYELFNFKKIKSMINVDMIGANYGPLNEINVGYGLEKNETPISSHLDWILSNYPSLNIKPIMISGKQDFENIGGPHLASDHLSFSDGIQGLDRYLSFMQRIYKNETEVFEGDQSNYHSSSDLEKFIDYDNLIKTVKVIVANVALESEIIY